MSLLSPKLLVVNVVALHAAFFAFQSLRGPQPSAEPPEQVAARVAPPAGAEAAFEAEQGASEGPEGEAEGAEIEAAPAGEPLPVGQPGPLRLQAIQEREGRLEADLGAGWTGELTTDLALQQAATRILNRGRVPFGAVVVVEVATGRVLAMADRYDERHPATPKLSPDGPPHLALRAVAPAASVFKIVSATALLEVGVPAHKALPYAPAARRVYATDLDEPGPGAPRSDMGDALADSNNGYFARLSDARLAREDLQVISRRFGFNQVVPFPLATEASTARVPRNRLERARMAAGFWNTRLTPLHGALIAAAVAGDGTLPRPRLVSRLRGPDGRVVEAPEQAPFATAMTPKQAASLRKMLARTSKTGTLRRAFQKWPAKLAAVDVGGKTGTLARRDPATTYTWFVGFAPVEQPEIAIAVMVGNGELWWQRAADVGRDVLAWYFTRKLGDGKPGG